MSASGVRATGGKVRGQAVEVTIEGVMSVFKRRIRKLLNQNGIEDVDSNEWYDLESFLNVLKSIEEDTGKNALNKIGEATPEIVEWAGSPGSTEEGLKSLNEVYRKHHQDTDGGYKVEYVRNNEAKIVATTPYPCEFDKGLLKGVAEKFGASYAQVDHDTGSCRSSGDRGCTYSVKW